MDILSKLNADQVDFFKKSPKSGLATRVIRILENEESRNYMAIEIEIFYLFDQIK